MYQSRLAGGSIKKFTNIHLLSDSDKLLNHLKHILLPSFVLIDATRLLQEHFDNIQIEHAQNTNQSLLDIWTDFFAFKEMAIKREQTEEISWQRHVPSNKQGWIVPLMIGKVTFTVKFLGNIDQAVTNNRPEFLDKLQHAYQAYQQEITLLPLAKRYVQNLANGRFLWRNRVGTEQIEVNIIDTENNDKSWTFNAHDIALQDFDIKDAKLDELAQYVADAFATDKYLLLKVEAFAKVGSGQRVFPSQGMRDKDKDNKSKFLYQIKTPTGLCAGLHSEKIGNAIRTIDTWYTSDEAQLVKPAIAIEPYGAVPTQGKAHRTSKTDLYFLMVKFVNQEAMSDDEKHFVVANLIRGGVFGGND